MRAASSTSWVASTTAPPAAACVADRALERGARRRVHAPGRLVEQQHRRAADRDRGDRDPLALTARQAARMRVGEVGEAERVEPAVDRGGDRAAEQAQRLDQLAPHRRREQHACSGPAARTRPAVGASTGPALGASETGERAQQRGLAGAVAAEQRDDVAAVEVEVDAVQHRAPIEGDLRCAADRQQCLLPGASLAIRG